MLAEARIEARLAPGARAPAEARGLLKALGPHVERSLLESALLLVSELVTNSVRHAVLGPGYHVDVAVHVRPTAVRLAVRDRGDGFVRGVPPEDPLQEGGWGLHLVDQLADRWGIRGDGPTEVWAEIDRAAS